MKAIGLKQCVFFALAALVAATASSAHARNPNGTWQLMDNGSAAPSERKHHTMIYDVNSKRVVLYGGERHNAQGGDEALGDVWAYNVECPGWQQLTPENDDNVTENGGFPSIRHGHSAAYVGGANPRMIIYGGRADFDQPEVFLEDAWSLTLTGTPTWQRLTNGLPNTSGGCSETAFQPRTHATLTALGTTVYLFGGRAADGAPMQDCWALDTTNNTWSWISGATSDAVEPDECDFANLPEHRYWHSSDRDAFGRIVVFGGVYRDDPISTAWAFPMTSGPLWKKVGQAPTSPTNLSRNFHVGVCDYAGDRLLMHGGYTSPGEGGITSQVTTLALPYSLPAWQSATWTTLSPSGTGPGEIAEHAGVYVPLRDWMFVFGGVDGDDELRPNTVHVLNFNDNVDTTAPATATLTGTTGRTTSTASWTFPGDDGNTGTACRYEFRRADFEITAGNFSTATLISSGAPQVAGTPNCVEMQGQIACRWYWYALKTWDESGNVSGMSTISMKQKCNYVEVMCEGMLTINVPAPLALEYRIAGANPGNGQTTLAFTVPADMAGQTLDITVFDVAGRRVRTLEQRLANSGSFTTSWDHRGADGKQVAVGMYFAKLQVGASTLTQKILVAPQR